MTVFLFLLWVKKSSCCSYYDRMHYIKYYTFECHRLVKSSEWIKPLSQYTIDYHLISHVQASPSYNIHHLETEMDFKLICSFTYNMKAKKNLQLWPVNTLRVLEPFPSYYIWYIFFFPFFFFSWHSHLGTHISVLQWFQLLSLLGCKGRLLCLMLLFRWMSSCHPYNYIL